jgi:hypothetical protein
MTMMQARKRIPIRGGLAVLAVAALVGACRGSNIPAAYVAPRTGDGHPDLNGVWQALNTAHYNLEAHTADAGLSTELPQLAAIGATPGGAGVVEGGAIPYKPEALAKRKANAAGALTLDPIVKCHMPGVPRATYMPHPFQIIQSTDGHILISYEFPSAHRTVRMNAKDAESPGEFFMGWSAGKWEGNTLVVDVTAFSKDHWLDRAGNYASNALHVVERFTRTGPDHLWYEATIEDPNVFTRPWKIRMPLYRRVEQAAQLIEFNCVPFAEELLYGHLRAPWAKKKAE